MCHCYEEADYQAEMDAAGQAEAEAQQAIEYEYDCYLDGLLENGQFLIYGLERCINILSSQEFKKSNMSPAEYLIDKRNRLLTTPGDNWSSPPKDLPELPF